MSQFAYERFLADRNKVSYNSIMSMAYQPDHNDYIVFKNDEDEAIFKQLKKYGKAKILHPLNPKYPDIELSDKHQYRIIGKVVKKEKR